VWGGNACPYGALGSLWFKASSNFDKLVIRMFVVQTFGLLMAYISKLLTQDHLPLGISFPVKSGVMRFVLPAYFLAFWGFVGRIMQSSFDNPTYTLLVELLLVFQEILQVWAYMHQKGPLAYVVSAMLGRGSSKVAADAATPEYRTLDDLPSKAFTYNFLICSHAVCEAVTVLVASFISLAYNTNVAGIDPIDRRTTIVNLVIALVGETIVADGLFCFMAGRQQRRAHTFLATWYLRPRGSLFALVSATVSAFLPVWYAIILMAVYKKDDSHLGYHSFSLTQVQVSLLADKYNITQAGVASVEDELELRGACGVPPGAMGHEEWCDLHPERTPTNWCCGVFQVASACARIAENGW